MSGPCPKCGHDLCVCNWNSHTGIAVHGDHDDHAETPACDPASRAAENKPPQNAIVCPFCGEGDFDLVGLKSHLHVFGCAKFEAVDIVNSWTKG